TIEQVNFSAGEPVEKGRLLVQLDIREETADLKAAKSGLLAAKQAWQRLSKLRRSDVASQQRLEEARAEMAARQARVEVLQSRIDKKTLRAPFAGIAGIHDLQPGQYLEINSVLTTLTGTPGYSWVDFRVPQVYPQLAPGAAVEVTRLDGSTATAQLSASSAEIDSTSRSRLYRAKLVHSAEQPAPGHRASIRVKVPINASSELIRLPAAALLNSSRGRFVYKLEMDEKGVLRAVPQPVEVTLQRGDEVLISNGIRVGENIAAAGAFKLFPGVQVYVGQRPQQTAEVQ
ncbi:MAG: efflux RND transporter periplasmic adaptor subunit, partial [Porticoccaceae bacterium]|nr:efflux RND transporter periplasmic adaptor subunit [Porticoccaceae bacterium]